MNLQPKVTRVKGTSTTVLKYPAVALLTLTYVSACHSEPAQVIDAALDADADTATDSGTREPDTEAIPEGEPLVVTVSDAWASQQRPLMDALVAVEQDGLVQHAFADADGRATLWIEPTGGPLQVTAQLEGYSFLTYAAYDRTRFRELAEPDATFHIALTPRMPHPVTIHATLAEDAAARVVSSSDDPFATTKSDEVGKDFSMRVAADIPFTLTAVERAPGPDYAHDGPILSWRTQGHAAIEMDTDFGEHPWETHVLADRKMAFVPSGDTYMALRDIAALRFLVVDTAPSSPGGPILAAELSALAERDGALDHEVTFTGRTDAMHKDSLMVTASLEMAPQSSTSLQSVGPLPARMEGAFLPIPELLRAPGIPDDTLAWEDGTEQPLWTILRLVGVGFDDPRHALWHVVAFPGVSNLDMTALMATLLLLDEDFGYCVGLLSTCETQSFPPVCTRRATAIFEAPWCAAS